VTSSQFGRRRNSSLTRKPVKIRHEACWFIEQDPAFTVRVPGLGTIRLEDNQAFDSVSQTRSTSATA
jgi:hypothetical protein